ncbi:MAG: SDR family oxidoreductase [Bacteroidetes bacterium]|nr:SDR family oxidoreductase [Bacteroidota bacterium]
MERIIVVGSVGFIGSACCNHFSQSYEVIGVDVLPARHSREIQIAHIQDMRAIIQQFPAKAIINASGSAHVGFSFEQPEKDYELNVANVAVLLEAIRAYQPECRFMNFSSAAVYGNPEMLPINEDDATRPLSPYGKHKLQAEHLLSEYYHKCSIATLSMRVFSAYGPGLRKQLFWDLFSKWKRNPNVQLFGTGNESRDFIYIDDVVKAVDTLLHKAHFDGSAINVASGIETTISEAATLFLEALKSPYRLSFSGEHKSGDPANWRADISKLEALGLEPQIPFVQGVKDLANAYKALHLTNE